MTRRSGAPRHFMMAMVRRRPAKKLEMALPTPTPPTSSEARPIKPMNWVSRSSQKRMPPPASASPLTRQPASGKRLLSALMAATSDVPGGRRSRYSQFSRLPGWISPDSVTASKGIMSRGPRLAKAFTPRSWSPPRISRASARSPSSTARLNDRMPVIAATPSARQAMNRRKPASPLRISRRARRKARFIARPSLSRQGGRHALVADQKTVGDAQDTIAAARQRHVMSDQDQGRAVGARQLEQQIHHLLAGRAVEIAGRLVGQQELGTAHEGARHGDPLLLAARELRRIVADAMAEADPFKRRFGQFEGIAAAGELQRQRHVLMRRHGRDEMEALENDADVVAPQTRAIIVAERPEIAAGHLDPPRCGALQAARHHHQAGFAGARGAGHGRDLP